MQSKGIFWRFLKRDTQYVRNSFSESNLSITFQNDAEICLFGLDKPERMEGQPWDGCMLTEYGNMKDDIWDAHIRPALSDTNGFAIIEGVPEGRNFYYDMCLEACGGALPITKPFTGAFKENPDDSQWCYYSWFSEDVLSKEEVEAARAHMSLRLFNQEYRGSFESMGGVVYYAFDEKQNTSTECIYVEDLPIYIGLDFNVNPMTAVLGHIAEDRVGLFREYYLSNSNTLELIERICADYPKCGSFIVTPCQSSSARQTSQELGITDLRIIRSCFAEHGRQVQIKKRTKNPRITDRVNCTNSLLENKRLLFHPGMRELRKDFGGLAWKEGSRELDLSDKARGHISAALDYLCEFWFPLRSEDVGESSLDVTF